MKISLGMLICVASLFVSFFGEAESPPFELWAAYTQPSHIGRVVLRNCGDRKQTLDTVALLSGDGKECSPLWLTVEPRQIEPGAVALVSWFIPTDMINPLQFESDGLLGSCCLRVNERNYTCNIVEPSPLISYAVQDDEGRIYLYLKGGALPLPLVTQCFLNGVSVGAPQTILCPEACSMLLVVSTPQFKMTSIEVPLITVQLQLESGEEIRLFTRLFHTRHTLIREVETHMTVGRCLTHKEGTWREAGKKAVENAAAHLGELRTIKFCNMDLSSHGPFYFASLAEQNHIEPQLAYPQQCRNGDYIAALLESAERTRAWSEPGIFFSWIFPADIHDGTIPRYSFPKLRAMVYAVLAGGSQGIEFHEIRRDDSEGETKRNYLRLQKEVAMLQPLLAVSEPVNLVHSSSQEVLVRTLLCGDQGILVFLFSREGRPSLEMREYPIVLQAPKGLPLTSSAIEIGGDAGIHEVQYTDGKLSFVCRDNLASVFFIARRTEVQCDRS